MASARFQPRYPDGREYSWFSIRGNGFRSHTIWPLASASSAIPTRNGSPGSPITRLILELAVTLPNRRNAHSSDHSHPWLHPSASVAWFERARGGSERFRPECREWLRPARIACLQGRPVEGPRVVRGTKY